MIRADHLINKLGWNVTGLNCDQCKSSSPQFPSQSEPSASTPTGTGKTSSDVREDRGKRTAAELVYKLALNLWFISYLIKPIHLMSQIKNEFSILSFTLKPWRLKRWFSYESIVFTDSLIRTHMLSEWMISYWLHTDTQKNPTRVSEMSNHSSSSVVGH